MMHGAYGLIRC